jgi:predicted small secreted protein
MMRVLIPMLLLACFGLAACHQPGPAERAGRSLDRAGEQVRDAVDPPSGPSERVGRAVDRALH